jgi:uncharacterized membrane protein YdjX (TVP38/TMEM64 family)
MKKVKYIIKYIVKSLPLIIIFMGILLFLIYGKDLSIDKIINNTPENSTYAVAFIMLLYSFKSISVLFPVSILFIVTGMLFPVFLAIIINIIGTSIGLTLPYVIGFFSSEGSEIRLISKYPKLKKVHIFLNKDSRLIIFLLRLVGLVPMDIVSIFMGSIGITYEKYLLASILGMLPSLVTTTFIGASIADPTSAKFISSVVARIAILIISLIIYKTYLKENK